MRLKLPLQKNGRLVIPHEVRKNLALENGDLIELAVQPVDGCCEGTAPTGSRSYNGNDSRKISEKVSFEPLREYVTDVDGDHSRVRTYDSEPGSTPLEELKTTCVCEGKWVESLAAISTVVRWADYDHPHDELWVFATLTQLDILCEWRIRKKLSDGELVRVGDLSDDIDLPTYEQPLNITIGADESREDADQAYERSQKNEREGDDGQG